MDQRSSARVEAGQFSSEDKSPKRAAQAEEAKVTKVSPGIFTPRQTYLKASQLGLAHLLSSVIFILPFAHGSGQLETTKLHGGAPTGACTKRARAGKSRMPKSSCAV